MNVAAGPHLAAAVTNAGGLGVLGGISYTPDMLREQIEELKSHLINKNAPFGVDLLLPQVGGNARKTKYVHKHKISIHWRPRETNRPSFYSYDYTKGKLDQLIDIIIESGAKLFVSAVGVPPRHVVEKLHKNGIVYMNMVGHPKHVKKCLDLGVDIICAQGGEGGGHTGDVPTTVLIPACVKECQGAISPLTGKPVQVVAAGGIHNGQLLAASIMMGATGVWVGTRFILSNEAGASEAHKEAVKTASYTDTIRTLIFTGRPLRVRKNPYIMNWEEERAQEIKELTSQGKLPYEADLDKLMAGNEETTQKFQEAAKALTGTSEEADIDDLLDQFQPFLMGKCAAMVNEKKSAKEIVDEYVNDAVAEINRATKMVATASKL